MYMVQTAVRLIACQGEERRISIVWPDMGKDDQVCSASLVGFNGDCIGMG